MIDQRLNSIAYLLLEELNKSSIEYCTAITDDKYQIDIDRENGIYIELSSFAATVVFCTEHEEFYPEMYKSDVAYIQGIVRFLLELLTNDVVFRYFYYNKKLSGCDVILTNPEKTVEKRILRSRKLCIPIFKKKRVTEDRIIRFKGK